MNFLDDLLKVIGVVLGVGNLVGNVVMFIYMRRTNRHEKIDAQLAKSSAEVVEVKERMARIETEIQRAPTHADLSRIYERMNNVAEVVSAMSGRLETINQNLTQIMSNVINKGLKGEAK